ncbi:hypothetical protein [Desulfosporosinus nitroreducens]|uniref:Uncharacterized protein n=1 Tax=Desulfosporosinus nitroreducens TaxID=2018668 RepID=A0ABT8QR33_9FIRM|nr:hypothetical protein [Desulfosporosinus nitroreducens]MDO0822361.1 hypothetical protein [Desulfosporosinus nitroreducens]
MAKAIKETSPETTLNIITDIITDEIVQAHVDTSGVMRDQYKVKRICTKTDHALKSIMKAHLEKRTNLYTVKSS